MAVSREQAVLELVLEFAGFLKESEEAQRRYKAAVEAMSRATEQADIDRLEREAREAREEIQRLGERGKGALDKLGKSGDLAENEMADLRRETRRLDDAIDLAEDELRDFNREGARVDRITSGVRGLRTAWAAVGTVVASIGLARVMRTIFEETKQAEGAQAQIRAAIASTGGAAGVTEEELYDMARGLQAVTTFGDDTVLGMQSLLLTFTSLRKQELPEISERVLDLATALAAGGGGQIDLRSAAVQLGKALQDPVRGITALRRSGIDFTEAQQAQIKVLVESNRLYEAQRLILDELATQVGGRSRAAATTFAGALEQARNAAGDLLEEVGTGGLSKELSVLARLFTENAQGASTLASSIGSALAFVASLAQRFLVLFELARGAIAASQAATLGGLGLLYSGASKIFDAIERLAVGTVRRIASLIPDVDLPGQADDALRKFVGRLEAGLEAGREAAQRKREEIQRELQLLTEGFAEVASERFAGAEELFFDLERIRKEIEAAGQAGTGVLRPGLEDGAEGAEDLADKLGGAADQAARAKTEIEGAAGAADAFTAAAARVPATRFSADLALDEAAIGEELAAVQARLSELRSGLLIDPAEEQALLEREGDLLIDLSRAQRAWEQVQVDSNRAQGESIDLGEEHTRVLRDLGLLTDDWTAGMGLSADQLQRVNDRLADSLISTGLLFDNVDDAATVTLPALDEAFLRSAEESGALDASLEGIAERLLVTAGNAEQQGQALQAAGEQAAAGQREAAEETRTAGEEIEAQQKATEALLSAWTQYVEAVKRDGPAIKEAWAGIRVEAAGAAAECERLAACSGAR